MEWTPAYTQVDKAYTDGSLGFTVSFHATGVGMLVSAVTLTQLVLQEKPDFVIQAGIAGCFDTADPLGQVAAVREEILGDTGVEEGGAWKDVFDLNLENPDGAPFANKRLANNQFERHNLLQLPAVTGITVNEITTKPERIGLLRQKYNPYIESMEGAALHYVCGKLQLPYLQIRAVSNYIGERDKAKWKMKDAIVNLNAVLLNYIGKLVTTKHLF